MRILIHQLSDRVGHAGHTENGIKLIVGDIQDLDTAEMGDARQTR